MHLYLNIRGVSLTVSPRMANAGKGTIWVVKFVVIGTKEESGVGFLQRKQMKHNKDGHYRHGDRKKYLEKTCGYSL